MSETEEPIADVIARLKHAKDRADRAEARIARPLMPSAAEPDSAAV